MLRVCSQLRLASTSARSPRRPCARVCGARSRTRGGLPVFVGVRCPAPASLSSTSPTSPAGWRSRSPLSSFARGGPGVLEPWSANHCRVAARLSDFLVVAASRSLLLIPLSFKLVASVWVRLWVWVVLSQMEVVLPSVGAGQEERVPGLESEWFRPDGSGFACRPWSLVPGG